MYFGLESERALLGSLTHTNFSFYEFPPKIASLFGFPLLSLNCLAQFFFLFRFLLFSELIPFFNIFRNLELSLSGNRIFPSATQCSCIHHRPIAFLLVQSMQICTANQSKKGQTSCIFLHFFKKLHAHISWPASGPAPPIR